MADLTANSFGAFPVSLSEPFNVSAGIVPESGGAFADYGLTLITFNLNRSKLADCLSHCIGLERDTSYLGFIFVRVGNLQSGVKGVCAAPEASDFALASIINRNKLRALLLAV